MHIQMTFLLLWRMWSFSMVFKLDSGSVCLRVQAWVGVCVGLGKSVFECAGWILVSVWEWGELVKCVRVQAGLCKSVCESGNKLVLVNVCV